MSEKIIENQTFDEERAPLRHARRDREGLPLRRTRGRREHPQGVRQRDRRGRLHEPALPVLARPWAHHPRHGDDRALSRRPLVQRGASTNRGQPPPRHQGPARVRGRAPARLRHRLRGVRLVRARPHDGGLPRRERVLPHARERRAPARNVRFSGKYSFQYVENLTIEHCELDTKDAFWHARHVVVRDSVVRGEYLGWYSDDVTFERCTIVGTQPRCATARACGSSTGRMEELRPRL